MIRCEVKINMSHMILDLMSKKLTRCLVCGEVARSIVLENVFSEIEEYPMNSEYLEKYLGTKLALNEEE